ncbi:MAG: hypothetical protein WCK34_17305, partial [Bacteroidota bacterium]
MLKKSPAKYLIPACILAALALLAWWFLYNPVNNFTLSVPGMDNRKKGGIKAREPVKIGAEFKFFKTAEDIPGTSWPRFRGENFDNICSEKIRLIDHWGKDGPRILWKVTLG